MTLNITILSASGIHQCSDFRLSSFNPNPDGTYVPIEETPKIITLKYNSWAGYLTYCGIGKWDHKSTYEFAVEWITALGSNPSFDEVVLSIESNGSSWIQRIQKELSSFKPHTFTLAAFENGHPRIAFISNTHSTKGRIPKSATAVLQASTSADSGTHVYVTGLDNAVPKEYRAALKRLVKSKAEPNVVRHRLSSINALAASKIEARNGISRTCLCYSIDNLGGGAGEIYGRVIGPLMPIQLINGINWLALPFMSQFKGPNAQIRQIAFSTTASSNAAGAEHIECSLAMAKNDGGANLVGRDLGRMNEQIIEIASANERCSIVGQLRRPASASPQAFLWVDGQEIAELPTLGGSTSGAKDVNNSNVVVGVCRTVNGESRATLWRHGAPVQELGTLDADNAHANSINDQDVVVGEVYRHGTANQAEYRRAFRWTASEGMTFIPGTEGLWSTALDINNRGDVLGWCKGPHQMRSFVWSQSAGLRFLDGPIGKPFFAIKINDSGIVIGEADDERGIRRAMVWTTESGLKRLFIEFEFHPMAIDASGNIVGRDAKRPWSGAWLVTPQDNLISIPAGVDHNVDACAIVGGSIFGHARKGSWKHIHPLRWDFALGPKNL